MAPPRVVRALEAVRAGFALRLRRLRSRTWQLAQKYVERPPTTIREITSPHRGQGSPSRVWTRNSSCIEPCSPRASR